MTRCYLALGSNIHPRADFLRCAHQNLQNSGQIIASAPLYQSEPYGFNGQDPYYNTALILDTSLKPVKLLEHIKSIEKQCGRKKRFRWGPREIDIDIIFYGKQIIKLPQLTIPHIDYLSRRFVLQPLCDLDETLIPPDSDKTLAELLRMCPDPSKLIQVQKNWWNDVAQN